MQQPATRRRGSIRRFKFLLIAALALAVTAVLGACGSDSSSDTASGGGNASSSEPIGIAGLEGALPEGGPDFMNGMRIATKEINSAGGIDGRMINLKIFKTGGTPEGAAGAYREAAADDTVIGAFLGATGSLAIRAQSERTKLPLIAASGNDGIDNPVTQYVFQNSPADELSTSSLVYEDQQLPDGLQGKKIALLHYETDYSQQIEGALKTRCEDLGCTVVDVEEAASTDAVDALTPQLTKMKSSGADVYFIEGLNPNALAGARQLGMDNKPIIAEQWLTVPALAEAAGKNAEGVVFGGNKCRAPDVLANDDPQKKWCNEYIAKYEKAYPGQPFALFSIYGYDAVNQYADAAKRLIGDDQEVTRDNIVTAMEEFDGSLRTSQGLVKTSSDTHRLTGDWHDAYVNLTIKIGPDGAPQYVLAPGADPAGATP